MDKRIYYQDQRVVDNYDRWRFGSFGGQYVDETEKALFIDFLRHGKPGRLLDMPCGTGRLLFSLSKAGYANLEGADTSPAMLDAVAARLPEVKLILTDALKTPYCAGEFQAVCSLRFLFHIENPDAFFAEVARILAKDGVFIFDSLTWTPRGLIPLLNHFLGGPLYTHRLRRLEILLRNHSLEIIDTRRVFLLPSQSYRFLPKFAVKLVDFLERVLPEAFRSKVVFATRKVS